MAFGGIQKFTGNGTQTIFTVDTPDNLLSHRIRVYKDGTEKTISTDYTISGKTIVFTVAPESNSSIIVYLTTIDDAVSPHVKHSLPKFIAEDHPQFITFLEAFYEYLEIQGNTVDLTKRFLKLIDIDNTLDDFVVYFRQQYLQHIPDVIAGNKRNFVKKSREFYRAKGTEKSFKFFFEMLFGSDVEFYYPSRQMFRTSDGSWQQDFTLKVKSIVGDPLLFSSKRIIGSTSNASAYVQRVEQKTTMGVSYYELFLERKTVDGVFSLEEKIISDDLEAEICGVISEIQIVQPGSNYKIGELIDVTGGTGFGAMGIISRVGTNGEIKGIEVRDFGVDYRTTNTPSFTINTSIGTNAILVPVIGSSCLYTGRYLDKRNFPSQGSRLQDSYYYQQFSYVLSSERSIDEFEIIKKILHPAGMKFFSEVRAYDELEVIPKLLPETNIGLNDETSTFTTITWNHNLGLQSLVTLSDLEDIRLEIETEVTNRVGAAPLGARYSSIERDKNTYLPTTLRSDEGNDIIGTGNYGYWDEFANYQAKDFYHMQPSDFRDRPWLVTNIQPEPWVLITADQDMVTYPTNVSLTLTQRSISVSTNSNTSVTASTTMIAVTTALVDPSVSSAGSSVTANPTTISTTLTQYDPSVYSNTSTVQARQGMTMYTWSPREDFNPVIYGTGESNIQTWMDPVRPTSVWDSSGLQGTDNMSIRRMWDESPRAKHILQSTSGSRAVYKTAQQNGKNVFQSNGSTWMQYLDHKQAAKNVGGFTIAAVVKPITGSNHCVINVPNANGTTTARVRLNVIISGSVWYPQLVINRTDTTTVQIIDCTDISGNFALNAFYSIVARVDFANNLVDCYVNDEAAKASASAGLPTSGNTPNTDSNTSIILFASDTQGNNAAPSGTQYGDIVFYNEKISDSNRDNLITALASRWAL